MTDRPGDIWNKTAVAWAVERWRAEVANRPMVNQYRRILDTTWRQVIRHFGGDDVALCGPNHDTLWQAEVQKARESRAASDARANEIIAGMKRADD